MSQVAFLGTGAMGSRMVANLLKNGHLVTVWNRDRGKLSPLVEKGARAVLGENAYIAAYEEGQVLSVDQVITMALANSDDWIDGSLTSFD